jgi:HNH endonuclease
MYNIYHADCKTSDLPMIIIHTDRRHPYRVPVYFRPQAQGNPPAEREIWAEIPGRPGYTASTLGNIMGPTGKVLSPQLKKKPKRGKAYLHVEIRDKRIPVHKLILTAFVGARPLGTESRHLNDDAFDNRLENLAWGSQLENRVDAIMNGRIRCLTTKEVEQIRSSKHLTLRAAAAQFGVSKSLVGVIRSRQIWKNRTVRALKRAERAQVRQ